VFAPFYVSPIENGEDDDIDDFRIQIKFWTFEANASASFYCIFHKAIVISFEVE